MNNVTIVLSKDDIKLIIACLSMQPYSTVEKLIKSLEIQSKDLPNNDK